MGVQQPPSELRQTHAHGEAAIFVRPTDCPSRRSRTSTRTWWTAVPSVLSARLMDGGANGSPAEGSIGPCDQKAQDFLSACFGSPGGAACPSASVLTSVVAHPLHPVVDLAAEHLPLLRQRV